MNNLILEFIKLVTNLLQQYGNRLFVWLGPDAFYLTTNVKDVEEVLSNPKLSVKSNDYKFLKVT